MTLKDIHKYEIEKVGEIFKKSKISFIPELKISIETNKTDIDILGMSKNILILVECFGTESFGEKLKKTITNLKNIKKNFKKVREIIKQEYPLFYRTHKSFLEGTNLKFRCLLVSSQKETKDCVEDFHKKNYEEEDFFLWTTEELYYYDKVSDCTYDHCKYEIFSCINVFPEDIEDDAESSIPSYIAYGKQIKEE